MTGYERQCRWLLVAFPSAFRRERGEDLIATLLDDARAGAVRVPLVTAFDLLVSGARMRAVRAGAARTIGRGAVAGMAMAAMVGLALQAALAVASVVYKAEHGVVFYLPAGGPYTAGHDPLGAQFLATWAVLAGLSTAALTAAVRGAWRAAAAMSVTVSAYLTVVAVAVSTARPAFGSLKREVGAER